MQALYAGGPTGVKVALDAIGWPAHGAAPGVRPSGSRPEETLAACLGLTGAVSLGDHLDRVQHGPRPTPDAARAELEAATHQLVTDKIERRRATVHERVDRRYRQAFDAGTTRGQTSLPDAAACFSILQQDGVLPERAPDRLAAAASRLQGPFRNHLAAQLSIVRKEQRFLREDVHQALRQRLTLGDGSESATHAAKLLALDAQLEPSIAVMLQQRHVRALDGVCQRFAQRFIEAVMALPEDTTDAAALQPWFETRGFLQRFVNDCRRLCLALLDAECGAVQALVDACCGPQTQHPVEEAP